MCSKAQGISTRGCVRRHKRMKVCKPHLETLLKPLWNWITFINIQLSPLFSHIQIGVSLVFAVHLNNHVEILTNHYTFLLLNWFIFVMISGSINSLSKLNIIIIFKLTFKVTVMKEKRSISPASFLLCYWHHGIKLQQLYRSLWPSNRINNYQVVYQWCWFLLYYQ